MEVFDCQIACCCITLLAAGIFTFGGLPYPFRCSSGLHRCGGASSVWSELHAEELAAATQYVYTRTRAREAPGQLVGSPATFAGFDNEG